MSIHFLLDNIKLEVLRGYSKLESEHNLSSLQIDKFINGRLSKICFTKDAYMNDLDSNDLFIIIECDSNICMYVFKRNEIIQDLIND